MYFRGTQFNPYVEFWHSYCRRKFIVNVLQSKQWKQNENSGNCKMLIKVHVNNLNSQNLEFTYYIR